MLFSYLMNYNIQHISYPLLFFQKDHIAQVNLHLAHQPGKIN